MQVINWGNLTLPFLNITFQKTFNTKTISVNVIKPKAWLSPQAILIIIVNKIQSVFNVFISPVGAHAVFHGNYAAFTPCRSFWMTL